MIVGFCLCMRLGGQLAPRLQAQDPQPTHPSLETSQARLDGALSTLTQLEMSLLTVGGGLG